MPILLHYIVFGDDRFGINGSDIILNEKLDFETNREHTITVQVTDSGKPAYTVIK